MEEKLVQRKQYTQSDKCKQYTQTEKYKQYQKQYRKDYNLSEKGIAIRHAYRATDRFKLYRKEHGDVKTLCPCCCVYVTRNGLSMHRKTMKHIKSSGIINSVQKIIASPDIVK